MAKDDEAARRARANALRQRIAALKSDQTSPKDSEDDSESRDSVTGQKPGEKTAPVDESPREFVHRRMRELDRDKRKSKSDSSDK